MNSLMILHARIGNMRKDYYLNYILNELEVRWNNTNLGKRGLPRNRFFKERIWIITYSKSLPIITNSQYPVLQIKYHLYGQYARANRQRFSNKNITITTVTMVAITDLNLFGWCICKKKNYYIDLCEAQDRNLQTP